MHVGGLKEFAVCQFGVSLDPYSLLLPLSNAQKEMVIETNLLPVALWLVSEVGVPTCPDSPARLVSNSPSSVVLA